MAISLSCPGCESALSVAESLVGKTIKCKTCGEMVPVTAPVRVAKAVPAKRAAAVVEDDDEPVVAKSRRRRDEDDDDRPAKKSGGSGMVLIAGLAAGLLLLGGAAAGGAYWYMTKGDPKETVKADPQPPVVTNQTPITIPGAGDATAKADEKKTDEPKAETPAADAKPETKPETKPVQNAKADDKKAEPAKTAPADDKKPAEENPGGQTSTERKRLYLSGELDDITMKQCKRGTVLIKCESKFGGGGEGSGWFGLEDNIVITNAHVISMIAPNSPPPTKLTVIINPGEYGQNPGIQEREIVHQRIKILAVDRHHDIAILQISGEKDLPPPFKIKPTAELRDNQGISIMGYPLGSIMGMATGSKKNPAVSVRKSTVAALRYDEYGILRNLQVQGGISPGNSGGPQFDGEGTVVAMTVAQMVNDRTIGLSVPTEHIVGLMAGRIDEVDIGTAFNQNGMVHIPVVVTAQDPMKRLKSIGVATWVGDMSGTLRPPGETRKGILPSDKDFKEIVLKYDAGSKEAKGTLILPALTPGQSYWIQPYYSNSIVGKYYLPGTKIDTKGPPCDLVAQNLSVNLRPGPTRPFTLTRSTAQDEYAEGEGSAKEQRVKFNTTMKGTEQVLARLASDTQSAARLRLKYDDADIKVDVGQEISILPARQLKELKDGIKELEAFAFVNQQGSIYKTATNLLGVRSPIVRALGPAMSNTVLASLQECSIPLPNKECQPNESWGSTRTVSLSLSFLDQIRRNQGGRPGSPPGGGRPRPGDDDAPGSGGQGGTQLEVVAKRDYLYNQEVKFTYQGVRTRGGKKEAVVRVDGKVTPAAGKAKDSANGFTKGYAFVDVASGIVLEADIESEFELDTSIQGLKQRTYSLNKYKLTRDGSLK
jgi:hypothetical protein